MSALKSRIKNTRAYAELYRIREEFRWRRKTPQVTPFGFKLVSEKFMNFYELEEDERVILQKYLHSTDLFIDIGANVGFYSCLAASVGVPTVCFEPVVQNLRTLYRNLRLNNVKECEVWPIGLSDRPGLLELYGANTGASLVRGWAGLHAEAWAQVIPVNTLDNVLGTRFDNKRMLVKIDVEGAEYGVLQGARRLIAGIPQKPIWLIEVSRRQHRPEPNPHFADTFKLFWEHGYEVRTANGEFRKIELSDVEQWMEPGAEEPQTHNWCFLPP